MHICPFLIYVPIDSADLKLRTQFYSRLQNLIAKFAVKSKWIVFGDFNVKSKGLGVNLTDNANAGIFKKFLLNVKACSLNSSNGTKKPSFFSPQGFSTIDDAVYSHSNAKFFSWKINDQFETWSDHCLCILRTKLRYVEINPSKPNFRVILRSKLTKEIFENKSSNTFYR